MVAMLIAGVYLGILGKATGQNLEKYWKNAEIKK